MNIFDYLFYRFYQSARKRKKIDHDNAFWDAIAELVIRYAGLIGPIIVSTIEHFFPSKNYMWLKILVLASITIVLVYFRFRNRIDSLNEKYEDCRLNKYLPDYVLWLSVFLFWAIGVVPVILASKYLGL